MASEVGLAGLRPTASAPDVRLTAQNLTQKVKFGRSRLIARPSAPGARILGALALLATLLPNLLPAAPATAMQASRATESSARSLPQPLSHPNLERTEAGVRRYLEQRRARLEALLSADRPNAARADELVDALADLGRGYASFHFRDAALSAFDNARTVRHPRQSRGHVG